MDPVNGELNQEQKIDRILNLAVNTSVDVGELKSDVKAINETVNSHTGSLSGIAQT